jgi:hypothetical protein
LGNFAGPVTAERERREKKLAAEELAAEELAAKELAAKKLAMFEDSKLGRRVKLRQQEQKRQQDDEAHNNQAEFEYDRATAALDKLDKDKKDGLLVGGRKKSTKKRGKKSKKTRRNKRNK